jgi:hypothetical protein
MKSNEFINESINEAPVAQSQWGSTEEICRDVLQVIEREIEWPLTEIMDAHTVAKLLAPVIQAVNQKLQQAQPQESAGGMGAGSISVAPVFGKHKPVKPIRRK